MKKRDGFYEIVIEPATTPALAFVQLSSDAPVLRYRNTISATAENASQLFANAYSKPFRLLVGVPVLSLSIKTLPMFQLLCILSQGESPTK